MNEWLAVAFPLASGGEYVSGHGSKRDNMGVRPNASIQSSTKPKHLSKCLNVDEFMKESRE